MEGQTFLPIPVNKAAVALSGSDEDNDGVADAYDLDDDNDGILDTDECGHVEPSTFSVSNGGTRTITLLESTDGYTIDISALDNSFNMTINGTPLVPTELQFDVGAHAAGESLLRFASDNSAYGQSGNYRVHALNYRNHTPSLISLRLHINANGVISLQGIRTPSAPLENLIIDAAHPQFNAITWNSVGSNTIIVSQQVMGPTFFYATAFGLNCSNDTDGDGIPNHHDLDSDNDGIPEIIEAGGVDGDGDGRVDITTDTDGDGLVDTYDNDDTDGPDVSGCNLSVDCNLAASTSLLLDTDANSTNDKDHDNDGDGLPNWIDLDADGDGILDIIEAGGTDSNGDGVGDNATDVDQDGYLDLYDPNAADGPGGIGTNGTALMTAASDGGDSDTRPEYGNGGGTGDSDSDDVPDFLDVDSDNDGIFDIYEAQPTLGYTPPNGSDNDADGIDNAYDDDDVNWGGAGAAGRSPVNTDSGSGDTIPDYLDSDADGDGLDDRQEAWDALGGDGFPDGVTGSCDTDNDGDGYVDCFDSNDNTANIWSSAVTPPDDDGTDGVIASLTVNIMAGNNVGWIFPNNAAGGSSITEPDWRDSGAPLPVEWLTFRVTQVGQDALVSWSTVSEFNADSYEIERSIDGFLFLQIGHQIARGTRTETHSYQFVDPQITQLPYQQLYYRLKQTDINGVFQYSDILALTLESKADELWVNVRPIPVVDWITIQYKLYQNPSAELDILTGLGQPVYTQSIHDPVGELEISTETWADGIYYVRFVGENSRKIFKVEVQH